MTLSAPPGVPPTLRPLNHTTPGWSTTRWPSTRSVSSVERMLTSVISMPKGVLLTTWMLASPCATRRLPVAAAATEACDAASARMWIRPGAAWMVGISRNSRSRLSRATTVPAGALLSVRPSFFSCSSILFNRAW